MDRKNVMNVFLDNKTPERIPTAFWYHFVSFHDHYNYHNKQVFDTIVREQKKYIDEVKPDFIKIMSDGFFGHPSVSSKLIETIDDLKEVQSVGADHEWITKQVEFVKDICDHAGDGVHKYYNIFSPLQYIRLRFEEYDEDFTKFVRLFKEDKDVMIQAAKNIAADIKILIKRIFDETSVDGIYYSVQSVQDESFTHDVHKQLVEPLDLLLLEYINEFTNNVIIHICGYANYTNNLEWYADYPAKVFNWAVYTEGIDLEQGKKIFKGKPVLGGFDNNPGSILYEGTEDELRKEIYKILDGAGTAGVGLGADCTVDSNISAERLNLIKKIASEYTSK
ncbi:MAG: uroporphyrinogen decarboxylase [Tissierella sp.]|nr:uroporphyrinogen decarboxylase [Tissierella sp.]